MVSCLMGDSTALASAIVRCCLIFFAFHRQAAQKAIHIVFIQKLKALVNIELHEDRLLPDTRTGFLGNLHVDAGIVAADIAVKIRRIRCAADTYFRFFRLRLLCRIAACAKQRHKRGKKKRIQALFRIFFPLFSM